jgi:hypothetical protein
LVLDVIDGFHFFQGLLHVPPSSNSVQRHPSYLKNVIKLEAETNSDAELRRVLLLPVRQYMRISIKRFVVMRKLFNSLRPSLYPEPSQKDHLAKSINRDVLKVRKASRARIIPRRRSGAHLGNCDVNVGSLLRILS